MQNRSFEGSWPERSYLGMHMDGSLLVYEELIDMLATKQKASHEEISELRTRLVKAAAESRRGVGWNTERLIAVGQKPALVENKL